MTHKSASRSVEVGSSSNAGNDSDSLIQDIYGKVEESVNRLVGDFDRLQLYRDDQDALLEKAKSDVPSPPDMNKNHLYASLLGVTEPEEVTIHLPTGIRNKGTGRDKRYVSKSEIVSAQSNKPMRMCRNCNKLGHHDSRNCPLKKKAQDNQDASMEDID
ncbi:Zinc finger, SWIM-type [Artemisia annua]|uniref:Zinc finger, SWIM-type n=1 Tax=Artemisia annua TaxID=35608 RepID=A0A2U1M3K4_ARTAN|nr:Zinc finger, SWIM-type [Artemisia annua]